jgi:glycosyltransferase involved in cell wall biosynthesis
MAKPLRILYAAGPGNVLGTYRYWKDGKDDPTQVAMTYSGQFYDLVRELGASAYVLANCEIAGNHSEGPFRIVHRPVPFEFQSGFLYHAGQIWGGFRLLLSALRARADVAVVCAGTHWFMLWLLTLFGVRVVPTLHCVLWQKFNWRPTAFQRWVLRLNGWFFARGCAAIITVSEEITQQVLELTGGAPRPVTQFIPQYRPASFDAIRPPRHDARPFRVLYVGRIERNKGVFDVLAVAQRFAAQGRTDVEFDLCGAGGALHELRKAIDVAGLAHRVRCHGHCDLATMVDMYSRSHVVIVPTTTDFSEGFNKVVAEGVLAGRPVITSSVCPALAYVKGPVLEVPPDDVPGYARAIEQLADDPALYQAKCAACDAVRPQFYDPARGWAAALRAVLEKTSGPGHPESAPRDWVPDTAGKTS